VQYHVHVNILLTGRDPILERLHIIYEAWGFEVHHLHEWESEDLMGTMVDFRPDIVVNGSTTEIEHPDAFVANSKYPAVLALYSAMCGSRMYHLSDGSVFSGRIETSASDLPFPVNVFGLSRMLGERAVMSFSRHATIVRLGWLYGQEIESCPPMIAVDQANGLRKSALVYEDMFGSPTFIGDAAAILAHHTVMIVRSPDRIAHLTPAGKMSWADLLMPEYPNVESTTVRSSAKFRDLRRNAGLIPTPGWTVPTGGLARFQADLDGAWVYDFSTTLVGG